MNNRQEDRTTMGKNTMKLMDERPLVWNGVPKIVLIVYFKRDKLVHFAFGKIGTLVSRVFSNQHCISD